MTNAWRAADELAAQGVSAAVINLPWLNRIDDEWVRDAFWPLPAVVTLDNHYVTLGQGVMIAAALARTGRARRRAFARPDRRSRRAAATPKCSRITASTRRRSRARCSRHASRVGMVSTHTCTRLILHWIDDAEVASSSGATFEKRCPIDDRVVARVARGNGRRRRPGGRRGGCGGRRRGAACRRRSAARFSAAPPRCCARSEREFGEIIQIGNRQAVEERRRRSRVVGRSRRLHGERGQPLLRQDDDESDRRIAAVRTERAPIGVCAAIMPFNSPLAGIAWKVFPALVCGNAVVAKSHELTPYTAIAVRQAAAGGRAAARRLLGRAGARRGSRHAARSRTRASASSASPGRSPTGKAIQQTVSERARCSRRSVSSSAARIRWSSATTPI